jgi:diguanylate cyclase (GGDEF)-like protein
LNIQSMKSGNIAGLILALVDDDNIYRDYMSQILIHQYGCRVFDASNSEEMLSLLSNNPIDCIILDYNMGVESGLAIGELIKKKFSDPPPIIMLTGEAKERTIVKAFRGGFSDFLSKRGLNFNELTEAVGGAVDRKQIDRAEKEERDRLTRLSNFDGMTGLRSSEFMKQRTEDLVASSHRRCAPFGMILIRVRELESIGDGFGYVMRERALQMFASRLQKSARETDVYGRYSEDSFICLVDREAGSRALIGFCERLARDLSFEANFEKASFTFRAEIGAALFPRDASTAEQLTAVAELALKRARLTNVPFAIAFQTDPDANNLDSSSMTIAIEGDVGKAGSAIGARQTDRRCERRQRVLKRGKILQGNDSVVDCMIRDISSGGARLRVDQYYTPPDRFDLMIADSRETRSVEVRWRLGSDLGVRFIT